MRRPTAAPARFQLWTNTMLAPGGSNRVPRNSTWTLPTTALLVHSTDDPALGPAHTRVGWPQHAGRLLADALAVLMEATPRGVNMPEMVRHMLRVPGVRDVHDLHVWSIGGDHTMLSCHVRIDDQPLEDGLDVVQRLTAMLGDRFDITHCTIQPETTGCAETSLYCALPCGCCDHEDAAQARAPSASHLPNASRMVPTWP